MSVCFARANKKQAASEVRATCRAPPPIRVRRTAVRRAGSYRYQPAGVLQHAQPRGTEPLVGLSSALTRCGIGCVCPCAPPSFWGSCARSDATHAGQLAIYNLLGIAVYEGETRISQDRRVDGSSSDPKNKGVFRWVRCGVCGCVWEEERHGGWPRPPRPWDRGCLGEPRCSELPVSDACIARLIGLPCPPPSPSPAAALDCVLRAGSRDEAG